MLPRLSFSCRYPPSSVSNLLMLCSLVPNAFQLYRCSYFPWRRVWKVWIPIEPTNESHSALIALLYRSFVHLPWHYVNPGHGAYEPQTTFVRKPPGTLTSSTVFFD